METHKTKGINWEKKLLQRIATDQQAKGDSSLSKAVNRLCKLGLQKSKDSLDEEILLKMLPSFIRLNPPGIDFLKPETKRIMDLVQKLQEEGKI